MLRIQPYSWSEQDEKIIDRRGNKFTEHLTLHAWCLNDRSEPVLLRINDFYAICHLELPMKIEGTVIDWTDRRIRKVLNQANENVRAKPAKSLFLKKRKLYYFDHLQKYPMLLMLFNTKQEMWRFKKYVELPRTYRGIGSFPCQVHETQIGCLRKLLTAGKFNICQWLDIPAQPVAEIHKISNLEHEYICNWQSINTTPEEIAKTLDVSPRIACFDIESWNGMRNKDDPMVFPVKDYAIHAAYMISIVFQRVSKPETRKIYLIVMGDCDNIPDFEIIRVNTETELCDEFAKLIAQLDPEIMMGYNTLGFDYDYLDARLKLRGRKWIHCSRKPGQPVELYKPPVWSSSGKGFSKVRYLDMPGRVEVDMFRVIKSEYKLPDNTLETASQHFLSRGKSPVSPEQMFLIYGEFVEATELMKLLTNTLKTVREMPDFRYGISDDELRTQWCPPLTILAKLEVVPDCAKVVERYIKAKQEMTRVSVYCGNDSILPIDLFDHLGTWTKVRELSNIVGVTPMETFLRGEQVKCLSLVYDILTKNDVVMNTIKAHKEPFEGGFVGKPHPGKHKYVIVLDFRSLYPSIIIAYNMCYSTLIPPELWDTVPDEDCNIIVWTSDDKEGNTVRYEHRFVKKHICEGFLPQLCSFMITQRDAVRKIQRTLDKSDPQWSVLEARQLALKVTGNSFYGFLGTGEKGRLPCGQISSCVTAKGRELIQYCNKWLEDTYDGFIVYNDTDSTMVKLPFVNSRAECQIWGKRLEEEISAEFPDPLYFELEYCADMFDVEKKMYAMKVYGKAADGSDDYITMKGMAPVRRDRCKLVKLMYSEVIRTIFDDDLTLEQSFEKAHEELFDHCLAIMQRRVSLDDLIMIKGLGKDYKSDSYFMKVFAEELKRRGRPAEPGSKLKYLIVDSDSNLGHRMRLPEQYYEVLGTDDQEILDYLYYVKNGQNIIDRIFGIAYDGILRTRRVRRNAFGASRILNDLTSQGFGEHIKTARYIYTQETGCMLITDECLIHWIMAQVIKHSVGVKKKVIQALKTRTKQMYNARINTERMVTGLITQNPVLTAVNLFEAKREVCQQIVSQYQNSRPRFVISD